MHEFDVVIVGAGLVGLACAEALSQKHSVLVVERHARAGEETSSRNSGVLHAGIYYPPKSLKATLCLRGRRLLEERCRARGVPVRRLGKLIVATTDDELPRLDALRRNAEECSIALEALTSRAVASLEPQLRVTAALWSPESAVIDPAQLLTSHRRAAADHGTTFLFATGVAAIEHRPSGWTVHLAERDGSRSAVHAQWVVNAAGLSAHHVARMAGVDVNALGLVQHLCKGSYFSLSSRWTGAVSRLVYPLPSAAGLGIHLTLDLDGALRAGPDAEYVDDHDLVVDETKGHAFAEAIQRYLPGVTRDDLRPGYAGLRPKLSGPGQPPRDFVIRHESVLGLPGLIDLLGIESPGLTASPAIAELVAGIVTGQTASA